MPVSLRVLLSLMAAWHASSLGLEKQEPAAQLEPASPNEPGDLAAAPDGPDLEKKEEEPPPQPVSSEEHEAPTGSSVEDEAKAAVVRSGEVIRGAEKKLFEQAQLQREAAKKAFVDAKAERGKQLTSLREQETQAEQALLADETALVAELERVKEEAVKAEEAFAGEAARLEAAGAAKEELEEVRKRREQTRDAWGTQFEETAKQRLALPDRKQQNQEGFQEAREKLEREIVEGDKQAAESEVKWDAEETRLANDMDNLKEQVWEELRPRKSGWRAWLPWSGSSLVQLESSQEQVEKRGVHTTEEGGSVLAGTLVEAGREVSVDEVQRKLVEAQRRAKKAKELAARAKNIFTNEVKKVEEVTTRYLSVLRSTGLETT